MFKPINTFDDAVAYYESIKPLVGVKYKPADDIRPLAARNRPFERIVKLNDNTYALSDGAYVTWAHEETRNDVMLTTSPFLWVRETDGDYLYVRNGPEGRSWHSRWLFLSMYLPESMRFVSYQQRPFKQCVYVGGQMCPLPSMRLVRTTDPASGKQTLRHKVDMSLKFKVSPDGKFERIGRIELNTGRVDVVRKKQMKPSLDAFYEYMLTVAPFVGHTSWHNATGELIKHVNKVYGSSLPEGMYIPNCILFSPDLVSAPFVKSMLTAPVEDDGKLILATAVLSALNYDWVKDAASLKMFRQRYNKWCTTTFDLYVKECV